LEHWSGNNYIIIDINNIQYLYLFFFSIFLFFIFYFFLFFLFFIFSYFLFIILSFSYVSNMEKENIIILWLSLQTKIKISEDKWMYTHTFFPYIIVI